MKFHFSFSIRISPPSLPFSPKIRLEVKTRTKEDFRSRHLTSLLLLSSREKKRRSRYYTFYPKAAFSPPDKKMRKHEEEEEEEVVFSSFRNEGSEEITR